MNRPRFSMQKDKCFPNVLQEWADYDDKGDKSVGIYEIEHQFVKIR